MGQGKAASCSQSISIVFIAVVGLQTVGTVNRNNVWKDELSLWSDTVRKSPDDGAVRYHLADEYLSKGQFDMAIEQFQAALNMNVDANAEAHFNLGNAYSSKGLFDIAIEQYQTALRLKQDFAEAHFNLGNAYFDKG
jgi:tetratricopeptide (TPR) repeat protein